jgi:ATP-dependent Lhr-like helicase
MGLECFHPAVAAWFERRFGAPTPAQAEAWPAIRAGGHTLIAAPTGAGKTLAAFLAAIDDLVREGLERGLPDETRVLYVSPLKALANDIHVNLEAPLEGIRAELEAPENFGLRGVGPSPPAPLPQGEGGLGPAGEGNRLAPPPSSRPSPARGEGAGCDIRAWVRTGDTPSSERAKMARRPPHIVVTTPESLYLLLTSESGRRMLATVRTVIVDEIHALAGNKRGAHLALSLERLAALTVKPPVRIGLSATQKPIATMAKFLAAGAECRIVDTGHVRARDLAIEVPASPLAAVMANEVWAEVYDRLAALVREHRSTLIFVNTRRLAERAARHLAERLGEDAVTAHHGSLSKEHRLNAERRLKNGELRALVATASLELGIDIGDVDLVCQLGTPRAIGTFLQRVGRSGHGVGRTPKGRLFPLSRDDLVECTALLAAVKRDELDAIAIPPGPRDVLAQQIVAEVANGERREDELFGVLSRAWPYRDFSRGEFEEIVKMLAEGYSTRRGRRGAYLHRDVVNGILRPARPARMTALMNGGVIPDQFDYEVVLSPEGFRVGTLNEDFAFETIAGDIFQLGNTSYRILKVAAGKVHVEDAKGQPPNIPFWFGETPGRTDELSGAVSRLRETVNGWLDEGEQATAQRLQAEYGLASLAAGQLAKYFGTARQALSVLPTQNALVLERFFDETGDQHLVIHSPFGSRINRAFGLALRKRFCRKFNFELQAAALEDTIVLSLGATHSFALEEVAHYLNSKSVRDVLRQAVLAAPMFPTHWRWNATTALAIQRMRNGKRQPPAFQRGDAEDLMALVFPDQLACAENLAAGAREIPDHPLVNQTMDDCLNRVMDIAGLERLLAGIERGDIKVIARDLVTPSPLAEEVLNARPYAFLDDAPAEERRTLAVHARGLADITDAAEIGRLDPAAITRVRAEAWPEPRDADELYDALVTTGFMTAEEGERGSPASAAPATMADAESRLKPLLQNSDWSGFFDELREAKRVTSFSLLPAGEGPGMRAGEAATLWVAAERLAEVRMVHPQGSATPDIAPIATEAAATRESAVRELLRSRLEALGPVTARALANSLGLARTEVDVALAALEAEGFVLRGRFTPEEPSRHSREGGNPSDHKTWMPASAGMTTGDEYCDRRLLARIHRYTLKRLRSEIEPVSATDFMRFLFRWQGLGADNGEGIRALADAIERLEGFPVAAPAWERDILPARIGDYLPAMLDQLCTGGAVTWLRPGSPAGRGAGALRTTPIALIARRHRALWRDLVRAPEDALCLSADARRIHVALRQNGASFFDDLVVATGLLRARLEAALSELVAHGLVTSDSFAGLRALLHPAKQRSRSRRRRRVLDDFETAGRWTLVHPPAVHFETGDDRPTAETMESLARILLARYGVVFHALLAREPTLPPWRELLVVLRRLEARGEIRGGRFVAGFGGEQYALPDAIGAVRELRRKKATGEFITISAADPLNLIGIVTPGERVPALAGNRVLYCDGAPIATLTAGEVRFLSDVSPGREWEFRHRLLRGKTPATPASTSITAHA